MNLRIPLKPVQGYNKVFDVGGGEMDGTCTADSLHLNGTGMMRWCRFLASEALADQAKN